MKLLVALLPLLIFSDPISYDHLTDEAFSIHILTVNPEEAELSIVNCDGLEKPSVIAEVHGALAAINGGFYKADGTSSGILVIDNVLISDIDRARGAIGWHPFLVDRIGTEPETGSFLPHFHPENKSSWDAMENILGSTPVLITNSSIPDFNEEGVRSDFLHTRLPRTALGIKSNGHLIFALVEKEGMTIAELAEFMLSQDCTDAINLCGGNSSSIYFNDHIIHAHAIEEKSVGNVIIIKERL